MKVVGFSFVGQSSGDHELTTHACQSAFGQRPLRNGDRGVNQHIGMSDEVEVASAHGNALLVFVIRKVDLD